MEELLVVSNRYPDLDGSACTYAYAEFLNKIWKRAVAGYYNPQIEVEFVFEKLWIELPDNIRNLISNYEKIVLVDTSHVWKNNMVPVEKVVEIIDHREVHDGDKFPNAKLYIDKVGSATTLIVERFREKNIKPSEKSALLLYYATLSHTINLQSNVSTQRDKDMVERLKNYCSPDENFVHEIFAAKSKLTKPLVQFLVDETAERILLGNMIVIVQLEMLDAEDFLYQNKIGIEKYLIESKEKYNANVIFLTMIDLELNKNIFFCVDVLSKRVLEKILDMRFENNIAKKKWILLRKEIWSLIVGGLEKFGRD